MEISIALNVILLALVVYQSWCISSAKGAISNAKEAMATASAMMLQTSATLREQDEHNRTREAFINDLLAQLPQGIEAHLEKQA